MEGDKLSLAKIIDRLLLLLLTLTAIGTAVYMLLTTYGAFSYDQSSEFLRKIYNDTGTAVSFIIACLVILLISSRLFYLAIRPSQSNAPSIDQRNDLGDIKISMETVENLALKAAGRSRGVKDLRARVNVNTSGIEIVIRMIVDGDISIPLLTEEIQKAVKLHIEEITGIPVASVSVYVANIVTKSYPFKSRVE